MSSLPLKLRMSKFEYVKERSHFRFRTVGWAEGGSQSELPLGRGEDGAKRNGDGPLGHPRWMKIRPSRLLVVSARYGYFRTKPFSLSGSASGQRRKSVRFAVVSWKVEAQNEPIFLSARVGARRLDGTNPIRLGPEEHKPLLPGYHPSPRLGAQTADPIRGKRRHSKRSVSPCDEIEKALASPSIAWVRWISLRRRQAFGSWSRADAFHLFAGSRNGRTAGVSQDWRIGALPSETPSVLWNWSGAGAQAVPSAISISWRGLAPNFAASSPVGVLGRKKTKPAAM